MWLDVVDIRDFYGTRAGQRTRRLLRLAVRDVWPDVTGLRVLGLGFATPVLGVFRDEAERLIAAMPAAQGVMRWPDHLPNATVLSEEIHLPVPDNSIDRIILMHCLESTADPHTVLREMWRVLTDSGRLIVIVPNRTGIWARLERSPFAHGRPFTSGQISRLLCDGLFTPLSTHHALFMPPTQSRLWSAWTRPVESVGRRFVPALGGVLLVEASKQLYATPTAVSEERAKAPVRVPGLRVPNTRSTQDRKAL